MKLSITLVATIDTVPDHLVNLPAQAIGPALLKDLEAGWVGFNDMVVQDITVTKEE